MYDLPLSQQELDDCTTACEAMRAFDSDDRRWMAEWVAWMESEEGAAWRARTAESSRLIENGCRTYAAMPGPEGDGARRRAAGPERRR